MIAIIATSHGQLAAGMLQSASMIMGQPNQVVAIGLAPGEDPTALRERYTAAMRQLAPFDQLLFMVDLWGGSPFNVASQLVAKQPETYGLVTGLNLPMLIEALMSRDQLPALTDLMPHLIEVAKRGIAPLVLSQTDDEDDDLL